MANLVGRNILIVDEVDDTRTTLEYAVKELEKDVETARQKLGRSDEKTNFSIFVLHVRAADPFSIFQGVLTVSRIKTSRRRDASPRI